MRLSRVPLAGSLIALSLAGQSPGTQPPEDMLDQYRHKGAQQYLLVNVSFTPGPSPVSQADLVLAAGNMAAELAVVSYQALNVTAHVTTATVPNSAQYYLNFLDSNKSRPWVELRADVIANLQANPEKPQPANYDRVFYVSTGALPGNGGRGTVNQKSIFVDMNLWSGIPVGKWHFGLIHELGHSLLWQHANLFMPACTGTATPSGTEKPYGDTFDPMGNAGRQSHYPPVVRRTRRLVWRHAIHRDRSARIVLVSDSADRGLTLVDANGSQDPVERQYERLGLLAGLCRRFPRGRPRGLTGIR